jgi:tetratricopeptide (TPR) repeat protein
VLGFSGLPGRGQASAVLSQVDPAEAAPAKSDGADAAIAAASEAILKNPQDAQAYFRRAYLYMEASAYDLAIADLTRAIEINPRFEQAYFRRAFVYMAQTHDDLAVADLTQAIEIDPKYARAFLRRAYVYTAQGNYDAALADLNALMQLDPRNEEALGRRENVYLLKGDFGSAIKDLNALLERNPQNSGAYNRFAWLLATCPEAGFRDGQKAVVYATTACDLSQWRSEPMLDTLAAAYAEAGQFDLAVKWENRVLEFPQGDGDGEKVAGQKARLALYEARQAYHVAKYEPHLGLLIVGSGNGGGGNGVGGTGN